LSVASAPTARCSAIAQRERVQVVREPGGAALLDRPPLPLRRDRRVGFALLGDLQAAAHDRVQQRRLAIRTGVLPQPDGVLGDQPVPVELGQPAGDRGGGASRQAGTADQRARRQPGAA